MLKSTPRQDDAWRSALAAQGDAWRQAPAAQDDAWRSAPAAAGGVAADTVDRLELLERAARADRDAS